MSSTEERYIRAAKSSHLKADEFAGDVDTLIASGSFQENREQGPRKEPVNVSKGLVASLLRVRGEYDALRGQLELFLRNCSDREEAAATLHAQAKRSKDSKDALAALAAQYNAESDALTEHILILVNMKTLRLATLMLWNFVREAAEDHGYEPEHIDVLTSKVMQAFLAPRCLSCGGRGFTGGYLRPAVHCKPCERTGRIEIDWSGYEVIGGQLLYQIEQKVENWRRYVQSRTRSG